MNYTVNNHQWTGSEVQNKLERIANLNSNNDYLIDKNLDVIKLNCITKIFWAIISLIPLPCLKEFFFGVNEEKTNDILKQLKTQIETDDKPLVVVFNAAIGKFTTKLAEKVSSFEMSAKNLIDTLDSYGTISYDKEGFVKQLKAHNEQFPLEYDPEIEHGVIEKRDLKKGSKIFVRADLHGDLTSLVYNLTTLQKEGLLDENFKCKEGVQLVFLGDYTDRGVHCIEVLRLLIALRMENPTQVTLIRGNHEDTETNRAFGASDPNFIDFVFAEEELLTQFYQRLTLTMYMAEEGEKREYVQFTHGMFELHMDPAELLNHPENTHKVKVPKKGKLSERVTRMLTEGSPKLQKAANRVKELFERAKQDDDLTAYNWGDMGVYTRLGLLGYRNWKMAPDDVKEYFRVCADKHKVKMLFRGHEHLKQHHKYQGKSGKKTIVSTMPVGMGCPAYKDKFKGQRDTGYLLYIKAKIKESEKAAYERQPNSSEVSISKPISIRDDKF